MAKLDHIEVKGTTYDIAPSNDAIIDATSGDAASPSSWENVAVVGSSESVGTIFTKITTMIKNIRYLFSIIGSTDFSSTGFNTLTNGIVQLNNNKAASTHSHTITDLPYQTTVTDDDTKVPTGGAIVDYVSGLGGGDMMKSTYDTDNNGVVDNSEKLNGHSDSYFAQASHSHAISDVTNLQTSLDAKAPTASPTFTGTVNASGGSISVGASGSINVSGNTMFIGDGVYTLTLKDSTAALKDSIEVTNGTNTMTAITTGNIGEYAATIQHTHAADDLEAVPVQTTAPTAAWTGGGYKICKLSSDPSTKYAGWIYLIVES